MTPLGLRYLTVFSALIAFALTLDGCGNDGGRPPPDDVINIGFGDAQPDLFALKPPIFLLTTSSGQQSSTGQAQVNPGSAIEAEIPVNSATRLVKVELANAWATNQVIYTTEEETAGNATVPVVLSSEDNIRGRYYMRLTLCGSDCSERQVVFDLHPCGDDPETREPCGVNAPYDRTLIEDGDIVQVDGTSIDLGSTPEVGSGTVLIQ